MKERQAPQTRPRTGVNTVQEPRVLGWQGLSLCIRLLSPSPTLEDCIHPTWFPEQAVQRNQPASVNRYRFLGPRSPTKMNPECLPPRFPATLHVSQLGKRWFASLMSWPPLCNQAWLYRRDTFRKGAFNVMKHNYKSMQIAHGLTDTCQSYMCGFRKRVVKRVCGWIIPPLKRPHCLEVTLLAPNKNGRSVEKCLKWEIPKHTKHPDKQSKTTVWPRKQANDLRES